MLPPPQSVYFTKQNNEQKRKLIITPKNIPKQVIQQIYGEDQLFLTEVRNDKRRSNDSDELINKLYQSMRSFSSLKSKGFHSTFYKSKMTRDKTEQSDQDETDLSFRKSSSVNSRRSNMFKNKDPCNLERQLFHDVKAYNSFQNLCQQKEEQIRSLKELIQQMETDHNLYQQSQIDDLEERSKIDQLNQDQLIKQIQQAQYNVKVLLQENQGIRKMRRDRINDNEIRSLPFKQDVKLYEKMKQIQMNYRQNLQDTNQNLNLMRCKYIETASKMEKTQLVLKDHLEEEINYSEQLAKTYYDQWKSQKKSPNRSKVQSFQKINFIQRIDTFEKDLIDVRDRMVPYQEKLKELRLIFDKVNIVLEEPQDPKTIVKHLQQLKQSNKDMQEHLELTSLSIVEIRAQIQELENDVQILLFEQEMQESQRYEETMCKWKLLGLKSDRNIEGDVQEILENIQEKVTIHSHELVVLEKCCIKAIQGINSIQRQFQSYLSMTTKTPYILFPPGHYKTDPKIVIDQLYQLIENFENNQNVMNNFKLKQKYTH